MSNLSHHPDKKIPPAEQLAFFPRILTQLKNLPQKKLLFASFCLHLIFFSLLFINWQSHDPIKPIYIPQNIQAHIIDIEDVQALQDQKIEEQKAEQNKLAEEQQRQRELELERQKQEALEAKRLKEVEQQKIQEKQKNEAEKQLILKKEKEEQEKKRKEKIEKEKRDAEEKRKAEEKKKLEEKKKFEDKKKLAEQKKIEDKKAEEMKAQEAKMLEKLKQFELQSKLAAEQARARVLEEERLLAEQKFKAYELTEQEKYMARIKSQIESIWRIPPRSEGLRITLKIKLLPNGELASVDIVKASGNEAFDNSATLAVKSVRRFLVPEDNKIFERNFRVFNMTFSPEQI